MFLREKLEVAAGVRQPLVAYAKEHDDVHVLDGKFMEIRQAMGTPRQRPNSEASVAYLQTFIEEMKASGFVAEGLKRANQHDAVVAPAG
jgi:polar amino acid transport system substrate-binding protein